MFKEFKEFALRGNVLDLAIGVVIGGAFGKIVTSFVSDILMPLISLILHRVNLSDMYLTLSGPHKNSLTESQAAGAVTLNYGQFINAVIDFFIIAFVVFLVIRQINRFRRPTPAKPASLTKEEQLLTEIRDTLRHDAEHHSNTSHP